MANLYEQPGKLDQSANVTTIVSTGAGIVGIAGLIGLVGGSLLNRAGHRELGGPLSLGGEFYLVMMVVGFCVALVSAYIERK